MALDFDNLPPEERVPDTPPSRFVWTVVFFVLTLLGIFAVLLLWPAGESTHSPWFWICITVYPTGIAGFVVSRVFSVYEGRRLDALAWNAACKQFAEQEFTQESIPLRILGAAIRVTEDDAENGVANIADRTMTLDARASDHSVDDSVAARWLQPIDARLAADEAERHTLILEWLYDKLLVDLTESITPLPAEVPLRVLLDVSDYVGNADLVELWQAQWRNHNLRDARTQRVPAPLGLMTVDTWLDGCDGASPLDRSAVLLISVSLSAVLNEDPPEGTAEAGIGLLIASTALTARYKLRPIASLHRPLRSGNENLIHALTYALRWGYAKFDSLESAWMTGFDGETVGPLHTAMSHVGGGKPRNEPLPEIDLDRSVGRAGLSAGWLTATCAVLRAASSATPQLVAQRNEDHTIIAVVTKGDHELNNTLASA
ncbi:hypothetical protein [Burkholderia glumae]|uniref:Uncharacterized protein n=1 Tax=Burkholderia glumae TaxID=337 RepID=A0AAP9XZC5_BURGL|nr:hypothetical protein [Burkholderia glumae]ACR30692.1 Hypothetical protein bglu_2g02200 [Burkholderia glumae BGR1]AJY64624.1 hypothetical protein KS03_3428 [Burkholderia glumae LMG 2196 = ATCC 33617]KHJ62583.1 hypothetical protein NCPPB3923_12695 [Burkholderia glumae]MCM2484008.1 hypothetical protein [Burkholderia glumae]MCM2494356.1 hypothetical protein [Burkholderia glumae]